MTIPNDTLGLKVRRDGTVLHLVLDKPPGNTLDVPLMRAMSAAVKDAAGAKDRPRAILLSSAVPAQFSQGLDPQAILTADLNGRRDIFLTLGELDETLWFSGIPIVADISGPALAGGAVLATLADFAVIDAQHGKIGFSEVKVGLPLPSFVQELIKSRCSPAGWSEVMLLGKNVDAAEALRLGFAQAVYSGDAERQAALTSILGRIGRIAPAVMSANLLEGRRHDRAWFTDFKTRIEDFTRFLTDDFVGRGLGAVVRGESPKF
jgi:enoyl-CoA hydratase